jgi:hypothetical protein
MSAATDFGTEILYRTIRPDRGDLAVDTARWLLCVRLSVEDVDKVNCLAAKARSGTLTSEERSELDEFERITSLLELMQSKARLSLKNAGISI